ncbi:hypothetical protein [Paraburkholderia sp. PGU19]
MGPDDRIAQQLYFTTVGDPIERFINSEWQAQIMAATAAHGA